MHFVSLQFYIYIVAICVFLFAYIWLPRARLGVSTRYVSECGSSYMRVFAPIRHARRRPPETHMCGGLGKPNIIYSRNTRAIGIPRTRRIRYAKAQEYHKLARARRMLCMKFFAGKRFRICKDDGGIVFARKCSN